VQAEALEKNHDEEAAQAVVPIVLKRIFHEPSEEVMDLPESSAIDLAAEESLLGTSVDVTEDKPAGKGKVVEFSFGERFVVDTMDAPNAKNIPLIIRGVALDLFPDTDRYKSNDYYSAYTYIGTKLVFVILKSKSYLAGYVPGFLPAMLTPGKYVYQYGSQYYVFEHNVDGVVTAMVHQGVPQDCLDLEALAGSGEASDIPQTMYLQWSLSHHYKPVTYIMLAVFIALLAGYGITLRGYKEISVKTARMSQTATVAPSKNGMPPVGMYIKTVADMTSPAGAMIKQIKKVDKTNLAFVVEFKNENDTREFIARKGGRYEDGKVVFAFDLAGPSQSGSGN